MVPRRPFAVGERNELSGVCRRRGDVGHGDKSSEQAQFPNLRSTDGPSNGGDSRLSIRL
jgi:hypothetical protein